MTLGSSGVSITTELLFRCVSSSDCLDSLILILGVPLLWVSSDSVRPYHWLWSRVLSHWHCFPRHTVARAGGTVFRGHGEGCVCIGILELTLLLLIAYNICICIRVISTCSFNVWLRCSPKFILLVTEIISDFTKVVFWLMSMQYF